MRITLLRITVISSMVMVMVANGNAVTNCWVSPTGSNSTACGTSDGYQHHHPGHITTITIATITIPPVSLLALHHHRHPPPITHHHHYPSFIAQSPTHHSPSITHHPSPIIINHPSSASINHDHRSITTGGAAASVIAWVFFLEYHFS